MKRIHCDLIFNNDTDALNVWQKLKDSNLLPKIKNLVNETSYFEIYECGHETNEPCEVIERIEKP